MSSCISAAVGCSFLLFASGEEAPAAENAPALPTAENPQVAGPSEQIVYLKNGSVIRGTVSTVDDSVIVETSGGILTVPRSEVLRIEFAKSDPPPPQVTPGQTEAVMPPPRAYSVELRFGGHAYRDQELVHFYRSRTGATNLREFAGPQLDLTFARLALSRGRIALGGTLAAGYYSGTSSETVEYSDINPDTNKVEHDLRLTNQYVNAGLRAKATTSPRTYVLAGAGVGALSGEIADKAIDTDSSGNTTKISCGDKWATVSFHGSVGFAFQGSEAFHFLLDASMISSRTKVATDPCSFNDDDKIGKGRTYDMGGASVGVGLAYSFR